MTYAVNCGKCHGGEILGTIDAVAEFIRGHLAKKPTHIITVQL